MTDYSNSIIYKICCKDSNVKEIYIGSTTNLYNRNRSHKSRCNNPNDNHYNIKIYKFIREHGGWDNWEMVELYKYPCNSKEELEIEERNAWEKYDSQLNSRTPHRTLEEYIEIKHEYNTIYYNVNQGQIKKNQLEYYHKNRDAIKKQKTELVRCDCGITMTRQCISRHKDNPSHTKRMVALEEIRNILCN